MLNKNKIAIIIIGVILILFNSCKKSDQVTLLADSPYYMDSVTCILTGVILPTGNVNFTEHGFQYMLSNKLHTHVLGSLKQGKRVQTIVDAPNQWLIWNLVFYAKDDQGNTYKSEPAGDPVAVISARHYANETSDYFDAKALISFMLMFKVTEYGLEYRLAGTHASWNRYTAAVVSSTTSTLPIYIQIPLEQALFIPNEKYEYRVYAKYNLLNPDATENYDPVYSTTGTFIASAAS